MSVKTPDIPSLLCFNPVVDSVTNLLQQLVRIPSVNPDGDPGTDQCGEEKLALWLGEFLDAEGFTTVYEALNSLTQYYGNTQDDQFAGGFTQNANVVDLIFQRPKRSSSAEISHTLSERHMRVA